MKAEITILQDDDVFSFVIKDEDHNHLCYSKLYKDIDKCKSDIAKLIDILRSSKVQIRKITTEDLCTFTCKEAHEVLIDNMNNKDD